MNDRLSDALQDTPYDPGDDSDEDTHRAFPRARGYKDLFVWREAVAFVPDVYAVVATFPAHERYGLSDQIRRAAISVPANIAEGQARFYARDFLHRLRIARGSLAEMHTLLVIAEQLGYLNQDTCHELEQKLAGIARPLSRLIAIIRRRVKQGDLMEE